MLLLSEVFRVSGRQLTDGPFPSTFAYKQLALFQQRRKRAT